MEILKTGIICLTIVLTVTIMGSQYTTQLYIQHGYHQVQVPETMVTKWVK